MEINFNGKKPQNTQRTEKHSGGYPAMIKLRKEGLADIQEAISELFENYEGVPFAIVMMKEDENGLPIGKHSVIMGVGRIETQVALGKALADTAEKQADLILESVEGDPEAMIDVMKAVLESIEYKKKEK